MPAPESPIDLPGLMRADLVGALKARDHLTVSVLRTALAAIANAEAPPVDSPPDAVTDGPLLEYPRLVLSAADVEAVVRHEIADRHDTSARYAAGGRPDAAADMQAEIEILERYVD